MSFWSYIERGYSMPGNDTLGKKFSIWAGRKIACRHKRVTIDKTAKISPESRIHPRKGEIFIGKDSSVAANAAIQGNIQIGENCSVQMNTILTGYGIPGETQGLIKIGNNVRIAANCMMIAGNHVFDDPDIPICKQGLIFKPITIEDDVWVAGRVNIMAGVTIGKGSVIGAGSVVTHNIPPYSVAVGCPAKVIKKRK